jgi:hypothetical protein
MIESFKSRLALNPANKVMLNKINDILVDYRRQGYVLTLRQAYYQLVSRDIIPNNAKEYAKLSGLLTKGRMAGIVDWASIEDRGRLPKLPYWVTGVKDALNDSVQQYRLNRQEGQETYVEVCIEKDALSSIFSRVTNKYHVNLLVNKGYSSCSAMYDIYERVVQAYNNGASKCVILYFGDHDPSGIDMIRDVNSRVSEMLARGDNKEMVAELMDKAGDYLDVDDESDEIPDISSVFRVNQLALNMQQIRQYRPPENPAKITDPRAKGYIAKYGNKSWELDALKPQVLAELCKEGIEEVIDMDKWQEMVDKEEKQKGWITKVMEDYDEDEEDNEDSEDDTD